MIDQNLYRKIINDTLRNCEADNYKGYCKFDYSNAIKLSRLSKKHKYLRLLLQYIGSRSPVNFRRLIGVEKELIDKGLALFAMAYLNLHELFSDRSDLDKAKRLLSLLDTRSLLGFSGPCWGHNYPLESLTGSIPRYTPNMVATYFVGLAMLKYHQITGDKRYHKQVESTYQFIVNDLKVTLNDPNEKAYSYSPADQYRIINSNAFIVSLLSRIFSRTGNVKYAKEAEIIFSFIVNRQTEYGAWYYADPASKSHLKHDNYHTGFVVDSVLDYIRFCNAPQYNDVYQRGIKFYRRHLFLDNGHAKLQSHRTYPLDIHGAAQGIVTFAQSEDEDMSRFAKRIAKYTIRNMYDQSGYFYYQKNQFFTNKINYIRWGQAWMCYALSVLLLSAYRRKNVY